MANHLCVHGSLLSQVLNGSRNFSTEQSLLAAEFFGLNERETDFYLQLVQHERAGSVKLKNYYQGKLKKLRAKSLAAGSRIKATSPMTEVEKAYFYSDIYSSFIRLLASLPQVKTKEDIIELVSLPRAKVNERIDFLLEKGLMIQTEQGLDLGQGKTHLPADSSLVARHHTNWRLETLKSFDKLGSHDLVFTAPMSLAKKDFQQLRKEILKLIDHFSKTVSSSKAETVACLNIDWIDFNIE